MVFALMTLRWMIFFLLASPNFNNLDKGNLGEATMLFAGAIHFKEGD
jgi:hypothetical protein